MSTQLFEAAQSGNLHEVTMLVSKGADVKATDRYGNSTALHMAARNGHAAIVEFLVSKGADANARDMYGDTVLHWAAINGNAAIVEFLVSKGADAKAVNQYSDTPLHWAARNGHAAVVSILESAALRSSPANVSDRRSAVIALISENVSLRDRLGIKPSLEVKQDFDVNRLVEITIKKREATDPTLRADVEAEIDFQMEASKMLSMDTNGFLHLLKR